MSTEVESNGEPRRGMLARAGRAVAGFCLGLWRRMRPSVRVRRSIAFASVSLVIAYGAFVGGSFHTTLGWWADTGIGAGMVLLAVLLVPVVFGLLRLLGRGMRQIFGLFGISALVIFLVLLVETALRPNRAVPTALAVVVPLAMWVGGLAALTKSGFGARRWFAKFAVIMFVALGLAGNGAFVWWLTNDGSSVHAKSKPAWSEAALLKKAFAGASPGEPGALPFDVITYGSGKDLHRPEFGEGVDLVTESVNGRPFVDMPKGWKGDVREHYWGFDAGSLPRNATVWCPRGEGPFPLVLCVHGNHGMCEASDPGYAYLGELLASRGFLFASIDENFLNSGGIVHGGMRKENDARAWMLLEHLSLWRDWNVEPGHRFAGQVDVGNIALIGHSRGGEAVCLAAVFNRLRHYPDDASVPFDYGFGIRSIVSIAPVDGQYRAAGHDTAMRDVSYFTIHGGHDADVTQFHGDRFYRRAHFSERGADCFKSSLWIYRANHGQFNTVWGAFDTPSPNAWLLNDAALMSGEDQRQIARVFLAGFLEATLRERDEYRELFRDVRASRELVPDHAILIGRYEDPSFRLLADFEEDVDVTTTSAPGGSIAAVGLAVWREKGIPMRGSGKRRDHGVELGWDNAPPDAEPDDEEPDDEEPDAAPPLMYPVFELQLPEAFEVSPGEALVFALAASDSDAEPQDYSDPEPGDDEVADEPEEATDATEDSEDLVDDAEEGSQVAEPIDFTIELTDENGATSRRRLSAFGNLMPPLDVVVQRGGFRASQWSETFEPVLQTFRCPLEDFAREGFDPGRLHKIRLVFDVTEQAVVYFDRVGFAQ